MRRQLLSTLAAGAAPTQHGRGPADRALLLKISKMARMPILFEPQSAVRAGAFLSSNLHVPRGAKGVVVFTASSAQRAGILSHFLRRSGYLPLPCEMSDGAPREVHVLRTVEAAHRTGATFVAAFGGAAALQVGKASAALMQNEGSVVDFSSQQQSRGSSGKPLSAASAPLLLMPSAPGGSEANREATILTDSRGLVHLAAHPTSQQGVIVDPALAVSLDGDASLACAFATLVSCMEGVTKLDVDASVRELAFAGVQRAAFALPILLRSPKDVDARADLALASLVAGVVHAGGASGVCRGLALSIAGRYNIGYSAAMTAVAPEALSASLDTCLMRYEDTAPPEEDGQAPGEAEQRQREGEGEEEPRRMVDALTEMQPRSRAMKLRAAKRAAEEEGSSARQEDEALDSLLKPYDKLATDMMGGRHKEDTGPRLHINTDPARVDDDAVVSIQRFARLATVLRRATGEGAGKVTSSSGETSSPSSSGATSSPRYETLATPGSPFDMEAASRDLSEFGAMLRQLRSCGERAGIRPHTLADFPLSDVDLQAIAEISEVDPHTLSNVIPLGKRDLLEILSRS